MTAIQQLICLQFYFLQGERSSNILYAELDQPVLPYKMFGAFLMSFQNQNVGSRVLGQLFDCGFEETLEAISLLCFYAR